MKDRVWGTEDKYVVLTHVDGTGQVDDGPKGSWELELSAYSRGYPVTTTLEYHRFWIGARLRAWNFIHGKEYVVTLPARTARRIMWSAVVIVLALLALGLYAAYQQVGLHSTAGNVITGALVIEGLILIGTLFCTRRLYGIREAKKEKSDV